MKSIKLKSARRFALGMLSLAVLGGCSSGSSSEQQPSNNTGTLSFNYKGRSLPVTNGSVQVLQLQLNNNTDQLNHVVNIFVDHPEVARVTPSSCTVNSNYPLCQVTLYGIKNGSTNLNAVADGFPALKLSSTVSNSIVFGSLGVESSLFQDPSSLESTPTVHTQFSSYPVNGYYQIYVTGGLMFSSGINPGQAVFNVTATAPIVGPGNNPVNSCNISSLAPECTVTFYLPESQINNKNLTLTANMAGSILAGVPASTYKNISIIESQNQNVYKGTLQLGTQTSVPGSNSATIPENLSAPLFINWNKVAFPNGFINLTISSSDSSIVSFYKYNDGDNIHRQYLESVQCTLAYPPNQVTNAPYQNNGLNCGFGIIGKKLGNTTITAKISSAKSGLETLTITPLTLTVQPQKTAIRTITVTNNATESIALGITQGGANAYISPTQIAVLPAAPNANTAPGGGSQCGITANNQNACPIGSTCLQGGESVIPGQNAPYYCYYDQPQVSCVNGSCLNQYQLLPGGIAKISISGSSGESDPTGIIWSGNYFARTKCNATTGICENATCVGKAGGLICGPGVGGSPGVNTLSEVTFGRLDYYDVSIINGINFAMEFGPGSLPADKYTCGVAGNKNSGKAGGLTISPWNITPESINVYPFPNGKSITGESNSYYRWVSYESNPQSCLIDSSCTNSNYKCGFIVQTPENAARITESTIPINESTTTYTRYCGKPIGWLTADTIYGFEPSTPYTSTLPFNFGEIFTFSPALPSGQNSVSVGDLLQCANNTYSPYGSIPAGAYGNTVLACGGVNWQSLGVTSYITKTPQAVNNNWVNNVQPTITWMKHDCPTCYTFPFDDVSSTFTCPADNLATISGAYAIIVSDITK